MRVFVMLKFLRDEIAAFLHSRLPDPLGEHGYEIYRPPPSQSNRLYF